jgi:xylulokinase
MRHLGIDLGTVSVKLMVLADDGSEMSASRPYPVLAPSPGRAETVADLWLDAIRDAVRELRDPGSIASIGFSGQMHGVVPWKRGVGAIHPAILWPDQRGGSMIPALARLPTELAVRVRNPWASGMAATTIPWLREHEPELYEATDCFLLPKDYVRWALTGNLATDHSDASGTLLYDFETAGWFGDLFAQLGLDEGKMPPILPSDGQAGLVTADGARRCGLPEGVPVAVGAGDTAAAILGSGLVDERVVQISIGTACQVVRIGRDLPAFDPALNVFAGADAGTWYRMAAMLNGGLALEWLREIVGLTWDDVYAEIGAMEPPLDLQFLPYLAGERTPWMDPQARGALSGLGLHHRRLDLVHAGLLGVACSVRLGLETLGTAGVERYRLVGGSVRYPYWNQLLATVLGVPLEVSVATDASARGAAILGARAIGADIAAPGTDVTVQPRVMPGIDEYFGRFTETYRALRAARGVDAQSALDAAHGQ